MAHNFLSKDWFGALDEIRDAAPPPPATMADLVLNLTVTGGPDGDVEAHMAAGQFKQGHVDNAPTKLTVPYDVARSIFIEGNQQAAMQAFMGGQIKVEGDMTKLMAMQSGGGAASPEQQAFQEKVKAFTA